MTMQINIVFLHGIFLQVLHDCRQLVSWDVWLGPETGATLTFLKVLTN